MKHSLFILPLALTGEDQRIARISGLSRVVQRPSAAVNYPVGRIFRVPADCSARASRMGQFEKKTEVQPTRSR